MSVRLFQAATLVAALCCAHGVHAASDAELAAIRDEIRQLKQAYEARIGALEARLRDAEVAAKAASSPSAASAGLAPSGGVASPSAVPAPAVVAETVPAAGAGSGGGLAAFNPAVSIVLQGTYANLSRDPSRYALAGFAQADDVTPGRRGLSLGESELTFSANVDDRFAGTLTVALTPRDTVSVEEAYGVVPSLGNGLVPKFGRFFSGIGYQNEQHQHVWDFTDAPLAYQAFLGGQLAQDGAQLKWVAPTEQFVELGAEVGNGEAFPGAERDRNGVGMASVFAHLGGDVGASHSWRAGLSYLAARPRDRAARQLDAAGDFRDVAFSGRSRLAVADLVWKYAPAGNARETSVKVQGEYFWRREHGTLGVDAGAAGGASVADAYAGRARGGYVQAVWQFRPAWRAGARYDLLSAARAGGGANADLFDLAFSPRRATVMVDYTPSEFSRFRLQYADSRTRPGETDHQLFLQYILTLGAHGAHRF
jgi:hypothetical protein